MQNRVARYLKNFTAVTLLLLAEFVYAFTPFIIEDIRFEGLRRVRPGTAFSYLPVKQGDRFDSQLSAATIDALFKTGSFKDIRIEREQNVLVIRLLERPAIGRIIFDGNRDLDDDNLREALKSVDFTEGRIFKPSMLEQVEISLQNEYFTLARYAVNIETTVTPMDRNRVGILFDIKEGAKALIHQINIVGNHSFSDEELLDEMQLSTGGWFSWFTKDNQYASQKLGADLETIRAYYLDRGYINFSDKSVQVTITPDKKEVYITINIEEGDKYTVSDIKLKGNMVVAEEELMKDVFVIPGDIFSQKVISETTEALTERIGDDGYFFANINAVPEINEEDKTVSLTYFIDPGKRTYVRRITFEGNNKTRDEVLRREMRQMEGAWISTKDIKRSRERLNRLGFFEEVVVETPTVPNTDDQVDVNYSVVEMPSASIMAGVGYSQTYGVQLNASLHQDNFLGTGKRIGVDFRDSDVSTLYSLTYFNPYTTIDGVSRNVNIFSRSMDAEEANLARYITDAYGFRVDYGIPISEYNSVRFGFAYDNTLLKTTDYTSDEILQFVDKYGNRYDSYRLTASWARDTRNRYLFPDRGMLQSLSAEVAIPGSDLQYYKVRYRHQWLYPLIQDYTLLLKGDVAYGEGFGDDELPFFENYTAGGPHSVRGFEENTLGPLDSIGYPLGGNLKVIGGAELILPLPFTRNVNSVRVSAFLDVGNVYGIDEDFDASELRYSTGLSVIWASPIGVLSLSWAKPLNEKEDDQIQNLQFTLGTTF